MGIVIYKLQILAKKFQFNEILRKMCYFLAGVAGSLSEVEGKFSKYRSWTTQPVSTAPTAVTGLYVEVPVHEPDLTKAPLRSAMKGAKSTVFRRQLEEKLAERRLLQECHHISTSGEEKASRSILHNGTVQILPCADCSMSPTMPPKSRLRR